MDKYIVVVEFRDEMLEVSKAVFEYLTSKGTCIKLTKHSYMLSTNASAVELRDAIKAISDNLYSIFVSKMALPAAWSNSLSESSDIKSLFHE